ncbi:hypothetical protein MY10362_008057 [Beauveria mimosiformis]
MASELVLVVGASGKMGVSAILGALKTGRKVLAVVRSESAMQRTLQQVGTSEGIVFTYADPTRENDLLDVVAKVKRGELPSFQHVFTSVGKVELHSPIYTVSTEDFDNIFAVDFKADFFAYRATMPYLIEHGGPRASFTLLTGGLADLGIGGINSITAGARTSLAAVAAFENLKTNVRFNEIHLNYTIEHESTIKEKGLIHASKTSDFAQVYREVLARPVIRGCRISVHGQEDIDVLKIENKLPTSDFMQVANGEEDVSGKVRRMREEVALLHAEFTG